MTNVSTRDANGAAIAAQPATTDYVSALATAFSEAAGFAQNITGIHVASTEVNRLLSDGNLLNQTSSCLLRFSCFFEMRSIKCSS